MFNVYPAAPYLCKAKEKPITGCDGLVVLANLGCYSIVRSYARPSSRLARRKASSSGLG